MLFKAQVSLSLQYLKCMLLFIMIRRVITRERSNTRIVIRNRKLSLILTLCATTASVFHFGDFDFKLKRTLMRANLV